MSERRHLGSTYRLQLNGLGFTGATELVPFLHELGVETCYVSPISRARSSSAHGYDVVDPNALDPALGTPAEFEELLTALDDHGMGLLVDIVPNHMAATAENSYFADVLRNGEGSRFAGWFDIAWDEQDGKILLPVLGSPLADVLKRGEIGIDDGDGSQPAISYFDQRFPVAPGSTTGPLAEVLARQHYRLADWREANRSVNYRRFFDINELIGVRQEDATVFAGTHQLVLSLAADQRVRGFRVDHVDGLRDPAGYLARLRAATTDGGPAPVILVEKILAADEELPDWPVEGTTGYEFASSIIGLFIDAAGAAELAAAAARGTGDGRRFEERAVQAKRRAIEVLLTHQLEQVATYTGRAVVTRNGASFATAIQELTASLACYRTYRRAGVPVSPADASRIRAAADAAADSLSDDDDARAALDCVVELLTGPTLADGPAWRAVAAWQQLSSPAAAKGVEDTALYDSGCLLAAADVGANPDRPALPVAEFHAAMSTRVKSARRAMSATSTHDSKRSHDLRCRLAVLSEIPTEWEAAVAAFEDVVSSVAGPERPDAADRRYLYETLVGVWPIDGPVERELVSRVHAYLVKVARESKRHSGWADPDEGYEDALWRCAEQILTAEDGVAREVITSVVSAVDCAGATNSLASVLLKATAPGIPDIYQGDDAWLIALVDPDNRRPLDAARHRQLLSSTSHLMAGADVADVAADLLRDWRAGGVKQYVVRRALEARRQHAELFDQGCYEPLAVTGAAADHVVAFARTLGEQWVITVVPRLVHSVAGPGRFPVGTDCWSDTAIELPAGCPSDFTDALTGRDASAAEGRLAVASLLAHLPVAMLVGR